MRNGQLAMILMTFTIGCGQAPRPDDARTASGAGGPAAGPRAANPGRPEGSAGRDELRAFRAEAAAMVKAYGERLRGELAAAIQDGGPAQAIRVCAERAPEIARDVSTGTRTIRRIGTRVRNRATGSPTPAQRAVLERLTPAAPEYVGTLDGTRTYLKAIHVQDAICLRCHGPRESLDPDVVAALAQRYPDDEATGYKPGDLRGAFVVEATPADPADLSDPPRGPAPEAVPDR